MVYNKHYYRLQVKRYMFFALLVSHKNTMLVVLYNNIVYLLNARPVVKDQHICKGPSRDFVVIPHPNACRETRGPYRHSRDL